MSVLLLRPWPIASIVTNSDAPGYPGQNLIDPDPRLEWRLPLQVADWATSFVVDLGQDRPVDTLALVRTNAPPLTFWTAYGRSSAAGTFAGHFNPSDSAQLFPPVEIRVGPAPYSLHSTGLALGAAPLACRYVMILCSHAGPTPQFAAGSLLIGKRWKPDDGVDWGAGRRPVDQSIVRILPDGGRAIDKRAVVPEWRGRFSWLSDEERDALWELLLDVGIHGPLLLCEDPAATAGLQRRIHYGTLTSMDFYDRVQTEKTRIELRLLEWV